MANRQIDPKGIQRKRIIYMTDAEWAALKETAAAREVTISSMIRAAVKDRTSDSN